MRERFAAKFQLIGKGPEPDRVKHACLECGNFIPAEQVANNTWPPLLCDMCRGRGPLEDKTRWALLPENAYADSELIDQDAYLDNIIASQFPDLGSKELAMIGEEEDILAEESLSDPESKVEKVVRRKPYEAAAWHRRVSRTISKDGESLQWVKYLKHFTADQLNWLADHFDIFVSDDESKISIEEAVDVVADWNRKYYHLRNPFPSDKIVQNVLLHLKDLGIEDKSQREEKERRVTFKQLVRFVGLCEHQCIEEDEGAGYSQEEVREFQDIFSAHADKANVQALKTNEIFEVFEDMGRQLTAEDQNFLIEVIKKVDLDKSGDIDFLEFLQLMRNTQLHDLAGRRQREHRLIVQSGFSDAETLSFQELFNFWRDPSGNFTLRQLRELFKNIDISMTNERRKKLAELVQLTLDATQLETHALSFGEFLSLMQQMISSNDPVGLQETSRKVIAEREKEALYMSPEACETRRQNSLGQILRSSRSTGSAISWVHRMNDSPGDSRSPDLTSPAESRASLVLKALLEAEHVQT